MEGHGSGGIDHDKRISRLEVSVEQLHDDSIKNREAMSALKQGQDTLSKVIEKIDNKLDEQRTSKPNYLGILSAIIAATAVIISIGTLVVLPIKEANVRQDAEINTLQGAIVETHKNRFTKQDGQRLEDKVDEFHDGP